MTDEAKQGLQKLVDLLQEKRKYVDKLVRQEYDGTLDSEEVSEGLYDTLDEVFYQVFEGIKNAIKKGQLEMTDKEILEAVKNDKKLSSAVLEDLVYDGEVVKTEVVSLEDVYANMTTIIKLESEYIGIDWTRDNHWGEGEFSSQPYLVKRVKKTVIDYVPEQHYKVSKNC